MTVTVDVPDELARLVDPTESEIDARIREMLVLHLFQQGTISSGRGAEILGITKDRLRDLLRERGIPYIDLTREELLADIEAADAPRIDRR